MTPSPLATDPDLAALIRELHPRLVGMLALYTGDRHVAEDLAQEALIRLHQRWPAVRHHQSPRAWTNRVALNLAGSWWRRRSAERRANQRIGATRSSVPADPTDVLAVRDAIAALPRRQRAAIVLRYYEGLSVRETAAALDCPEGTVKSLTSQGIAALRRHLVDLPDLVVPAEPASLETTHA